MKKNTFLLFFIIGFSFAWSSGSANSHTGGWLDKWLTIDVGLLYWTILTFLVLLFILRWKAWSPLMQALNARSKKIADSLSKAETISAQAEKQAIKNEEILNLARQEAQDIILKAREAGDKLKHKLEEDGKKQYNSILEKAKEDIEREKEKIIIEIKEEVVNLSVMAAEKIIDKSLNAREGDIVIAVLHGEFTVKQLSIIDNTFFIAPKNTQYSPVKISAEMDFSLE